MDQWQYVNGTNVKPVADSTQSAENQAKTRTSITTGGRKGESGSYISDKCIGIAINKEVRYVERAMDEITESLSV